MSPPTLIIPNLYLGDVNNATNLLHPFIKELKIKHVINCCKGCPNYFPNEYHYLNLVWIDNYYQELNKDNELIKTLEFIIKCLDNNEGVFVHCGAGVSRSAILIIAVLMKRYNWDYDQAFSFVKEKRERIRPNPSFIEQIKNLFSTKSEIDF